MTTSETSDAEYQALGDYIWSHMPYEYDADAEPSFVLNSKTATVLKGALRLPADAAAPTLLSPQIDGPAKKFGGGAPHLPKTDKEAVDKQGQIPEVLSEEQLRRHPSTSLWWSFPSNGRQYRVTKALLIPYTINDKSSPDADANGVVVKHLLVGFMGVDAGGG